MGESPRPSGHNPSLARALPSDCDEVATFPSRSATHDAVRGPYGPTISLAEQHCSAGYTPLLREPSRMDVADHTSHDDRSGCATTAVLPTQWYSGTLRILHGDNRGSFPEDVTTQDHHACVGLRGPQDLTW